MNETKTEITEIENVAEAPEFVETLPEAIARLAAMTTLDYDQVRVTEAKRLMVRLTTLDDEVKKLRKRESGVDANQRARERLGIVDIAPSSEPVKSGAKLLDEILTQLKRFIIASDTSLHALTLWIVLTYLMDNPGIATSPRLAVVSPVKRCGKSKVLAVILQLVFRPIAASNISPSAIFRACDACTLTFLIDEADSFVGVKKASERSEELRGILNSGHTRPTAFVIRNVAVADEWLAQKFSTWSAFAFAAIGNLPDTLMDRSIKMVMARKLTTEKIEKMRATDDARIEMFRALSSKIKRWTDDNAASIVALRLEPPSSLNDRAADNWEPLLAIAEIASGEWPKRARDAAVKLSNESESFEQTLSAMLLKDIRAIFEAAKDSEGYPNLSSAEICGALVVLEGQPWADFRAGKPITPNQLARLLKPFGVFPDTVKTRADTLKGYKYSDFRDVFARYLDAGAEVPESKTLPKFNRKPKGEPPKPKRGSRKFARNYKSAA